MSSKCKCQGGGPLIDLAHEKADGVVVEIEQLMTGQCVLKAVAYLDGWKDIGGGMLPINFCPICGTKLPQNWGEPPESVNIIQDTWPEATVEELDENNEIVRTFPPKND